LTDIPFYDFRATTLEQREEILAALAATIDHAWLIMGRELEAFEEEFARYCGAKHAIGVGNGLDALSLALRAFGVSSGDEVIVPSQTFVATWLAVSHLGAVPVSVDIEEDSFNIDPERIEAAITPRTRAIVPVHLFGLPADMEAINAIAERHGLAVLEDAAQAHGATCRGRRAGTLGRMAAFSFYPTKNLGAYGDGGAVVTDDPELAAEVRRLRNYGSVKKYVHENLGVNSRLDELQAAILRIKLRTLDRNNDLRRAAADYYRAGLSNLKGLALPSEQAGMRHVYHLFVVRHPRRDWLAQGLAERGIHTAIHYPIAPGRQPAYASHYAGADMARGVAAAETSLSLPLWPQITRADQDRVIDGIRDMLLGDGD
jgi:dTDP-4-amino-4,6-dideoxygalactose transaminase